MKLYSPFVITPRLLPGLKIGTAFLSIEYSRNGSDGRTHYKYHLDTEGFEYSSSDLKSGCQGGNLQDGMGSLLSFLGAAAESAGYYMRTGLKGDNYDLFPESVVQWAYNHSDEIAMLQCEIEESKAELIALGLLKSNGAITDAGRNAKGDDRADSLRVPGFKDQWAID